MEELNNAFSQIFHGDKGKHLIEFAKREAGIAVVSPEEAESVGVKKGDVEWGQKLKPLLVEQGISEDKLYQGSTEVEFFFTNGHLILREKGNE